MNKKITLGLAISMVAIACAITFILTSFFSLQSFNGKVADVSEKSAKYERLAELDQFIRKNYFKDLNETGLNMGILKGYVEGLGDKYSRYLTAEEYADEIADNEGEVIGIGITVEPSDGGYVKINGIIEKSPVYDSEIKLGDIIVAINGKDVLTVGFDASVDELRGAAGTDIVLTVRRDGIDKNYKFTRRSIEVTSVSGRILSGSVGYIKIDGFRKNTPDQFIDEIERLMSNGATSLIFDVRDNSSSLLSSLEKCVSPLLSEGIIASAVYSADKVETVIYSENSGMNIPMVVIVNSNTAGAGELFAASLKEFGKAQLVGEQTAGKGVMQIMHQFDDKSGVVLSIAEYRVGESEGFNGVGLIPEHIVEKSVEANIDAQLNKAIEILMVQ